MATVRSFLDTHPQTLADYELADEQRYLESTALVIAGKSAGGVYLLGYVAEMVLKHAYFAVRGGYPSQLVTPGPAKLFATERGVTAPHESFHSLLFWQDVLLAARVYHGRPIFSSAFEGLLRNHVSVVYNQWKVDMRYRQWRFTSTEVNQIWQAVTWIKDHQQDLEN